MSAHNAHRGRYRKYIGLAVAGAAGGLFVVGTAAAGSGQGEKPEKPDRGVMVTKTPSVTSVVPGGVVEYDIKVTNTGKLPIPEQFIKVTDPGADGDPEFVRIDGGNEKWPLKTDETAVYRAMKTVSLDVSQCGKPVTNTAYVSINTPVKEEEGEEDAKGKKASAAGKRKALKARAKAVAEPPWSMETSAQAAVLVQGGTCPVPEPPVGPSSVVTPAATPVAALRPAALGLEKVGPARALAGGFVAFQLRVTNSGQTDATDVVLRDTPPRALQWRAVPTGAKVSGSTAEWNLGTIGAGQTVTKTVRFRARLTASGRVCNTATVSSTNAGAALDRACVTVTTARRPATPVTG